MVDLLVGGAKRTFGGLSMNGCCHMLDEYVDAEDDFLSWHLFGDPSLRVRTDTPESLLVLHAPSTAPGNMTFDVIVDGVEGALCALSHDGVSYGAAFTDAGGTAVINIDGVLPAGEDVLVMVTSFNAVPYLGSVQVEEVIIDVAPSFFSVSVESGGTATDTLTVSNVGEPLSILSYSIEIADAGMSRHSDDSGITVSPTECEPGTTLDLVFALTNEGTDGEWVNGATLDFPDGVVVNSSTDFVVSDRALAWRGASGSGARLTWEGNWWNVVYPGSTAVATLNVTIDAGFEGDVEIVFGLQGDGYGDPPHSLSGTLEIDSGVEPPLTFTLLAPNGNEAWGAGEARGITWDSSGAPVLVDIFYSVDGGGDWTTVVEGTDNDGEYTWMVDAPISDNCLVKVNVTGDPSVGDISDASFSIYQPIEWLSVTPASGAVAAGAMESIEVQFDAAGMADGDYYADIVITNSGGEPVVIPATLHVATTGTDDRIPQKPVVYGNYPNPFRPSTRIAFSIPTTMRVTLQVYSVDGRLVRTLTDAVYDGPDRHAVPWNGKDAAGERVSDGVYFYRLVADGTELTGKMALLH